MHVGISLYLFVFLILEFASAAQDWRGDPCSRAGIPWRPFTTRVRLDPDSIARLMTRTTGLTDYFCTRETVEMYQGSEDTIVVDFDITLSLEELQDRVKLVRNSNDVALIVDGSGIGREGSHECIISRTSIALPPSIHHLTIDTQTADLMLDQIDASFATLEMFSLTGNLKIANSTLRLQKTMEIGLQSGTMQVEKSLIRGAQSLDIGRHVNAEFEHMHHDLL